MTQTPVLPLVDEETGSGRIPCHQAPVTGQHGGPWSSQSPIPSKDATVFWKIRCFQFCLLGMEFEQNLYFGLVGGGV